METNVCEPGGMARHVAVPVTDAQGTLLPLSQMQICSAGCGMGTASAQRSLAVTFRYPCMRQGPFVSLGLKIKSLFSSIIQVLEDLSRDALSTRFILTS